MARIRNTHCLIGSRNFSIPTHKQRFMFFHPEDVKNGTMDKWMKFVQINRWERHDNEDCTVFHFFSMLGNSNCIKRILDDASVLSVIGAARIGILARLNKLLYNIGLLSHSNTTSKNVTTKRPNVVGAKKQSIERMVSMVQKLLDKRPVPKPIEM
jgi:hypothetical protein